MTETAGPPRPDSAPELNVGVISTDLCIGTNRLAFFLLDSESEPVRDSVVSVFVYHHGEEGESELGQLGRARFRPWPMGGLGVYTTQVIFNRTGEWGLRVVVDGPDGSTRYGQGVFQVKKHSATPPLGSLAPLTVNKTARDVPTLQDLTTAQPPDPQLYQMTIADAVASRRPLVVVFATPAFCQTATCGPQVEVVGEIRVKYRGLANFVHVEIFDNPGEIQGDLSKARPTAAVEEWGLPTEPWTFIVDRNGRIAAKFEGFTTAEEIEEALIKVSQ